MKLAVALILLLAFDSVRAMPPPPSFCEKNPSRCPALTKSERARFARLARTLRRIMPSPKPYKRELRTIGPGRIGYGRRGSAFPQRLIIQASYFIDPDSNRYAKDGVIEMTPLPVAAFHNKGGVIVEDKPGWLVIEYRPGHPSYASMTRYEIVVGQRAGAGVPRQYPPNNAPAPAGLVRSIHIGILGPHKLAKQLRDGLSTRTLLALVDMKR